MTQAQLIHCPACGATNRVPGEKLQQGLQPRCGRCKNPLLAHASPVVVSDATFASEVERSQLPVLVDAWAPWCGPCRSIAPLIDELAAELVGKMRFAKLNVDDNPATSQRFQIASIPTLLVFQEGRVVDRMVGAMPKTEIKRRLQRIIPE
jgi:thioredoxin 2